MGVRCRGAAPVFRYDSGKEVSGSLPLERVRGEYHLVEVYSNSAW